jgi:SWI/SNF-related matrix-associated actin-dependent regulator 1 of chromatin subfamily A
MSYDLMSMRLDELRRNAFYALIFDECHMLKERTSKRTKAADNLAVTTRQSPVHVELFFPLQKRASRLLMLSGTPALSRPVELYSQIRMLDPRIFPNFKEYALRYCEGRQGRWGFEAKGQSNPLELKAVMNRIMIRCCAGEGGSLIGERRTGG